MKLNWELKKVKDFAEVVGGGTPSTEVRDYWGGGIPWISPKDLSKYNSKYIKKGNKSITQLGIENSSAKLLPSKSLLFSSRAPIGYLAINTIPVTTNQGFKSLIPKKGFCVEYLYYLFKNNIKILESYSAGTTFKEISGSVIKEIEFLMPGYNEQIKISNVLSILDEKIELNKKINENLQELAKILFKSWFIDFDPVRAKVENRSTGLSKEISDLFPNSFQESEVGDIPKNWKVVNLDYVTSKFTTGLNPRKNFVLGSGENFYITIKNLGDFEIVLDDKCDKVNSEAIKKINARSNLNKDDILFSGIGTIGKVIYVFDEPKNWNISESVFSMKANPDVIYPSFLYQLLKSYPLQSYVEAHAEGSVQKGIRMGSLKLYKFPLSNFEIQNKFNEIISPMINKISINLKEIKNLVAIRDILLPKLISGELRISDVEKIVQENSV